MTRVPRAAGLALLLLLAPLHAARAADPPAAAFQRIAIAEDERRWSDGELRGFLTDARPEVRARAALAVGRLQDSTSVSALLPLLADASVEVKREAVFALGQIGHRSAATPLLAKLNDPDPETSIRAIEALGKLGDKATTARVAQFLANASAAKRGAAAVALWRLADSTALEDLAAHHRDPDPEVRWRVLYAMEKIIRPEQVVLLAATHLQDPEWLVRAYAARTIGRQKSARGTAYLLQVLNDESVPVVVNAVRALQLIADSTCTRCAGDLARLVGDSEPYVRVTAATALAERFAFRAADSLRRVSALDSLTVHLKDHDPATRGACARALLRQTGAEAYPLVTPVLSDSSVYARVAALDGLRDLPPQGDWLKLVRARMAPGRHLLERTTAVELLGTLRPKGAAAELRAGLRDTSVLYVAACAATLAEMKDTTSVKSLVAAYKTRGKDADPDARTAIHDAIRDLAGASLADSVAKLPVRSADPPHYAQDFALPPAAKGARIRTSRGDIEWSFYGAEAPQTVKNFVRLARRGYFNGNVFHRVVPNFVIQDGDPTGTGSGGPGYTIRCEYNALHYDPGMVGMALSGKDTGGSQWFITHSPQLHLDGRYTIFARVTHGMDVVNKIVQGDRILSVEILE